MKRLLILGVAVAVVTAAAVVIAAGGGGGGDSAPSAAQPRPNGSTVSTQAIGDSGEVLVDSEGQALYAADQETAADMVLCAEGCTSFWEPLTVSGGPPTGDVSGDLGVVERPDGSRQVTLNGKLLYSFVEDEPGEVTGDGFPPAPRPPAHVPPPTPAWSLYTVPRPPRR
jgi:predicted lipoprotein with Yx(FWY)xxD motif